MVISLLVEVLSIQVSDKRVHTAVRSVLELCSEMSQEPVNLLWPLLIAGACAIGEDRDWVRQLFTTFQGDYCQDLETAVSSERRRYVKYPLNDAERVIVRAVDSTRLRWLIHGVADLDEEIEPPRLSVVV